MAEVAVRSRGKGTVDELLAGEYVRRAPEGVTTCHRSPTVPRPWFWPRGDPVPASSSSGRPTSPVSTIVRSATTRRSERSTTPPSTRMVAAAAASDSATSRWRWPSCRPCLHPRGAAPALGAWPRVRASPSMPSGGALKANLDHGHRSQSYRLCRRAHFQWWRPVAGACHQRPMPTTESHLHPGGTVMIPVAVVGVGQTHHKTRRRDVSVGGMVREAVFRALEDAQMTIDDIDAVVLGKAPDLFEGVMKPELYLSDALGAGRQADDFGYTPLAPVGWDHRHRRRAARAGRQAQDGCWPSPSRSSPCSKAMPSSHSAPGRGPRWAPEVHSPPSFGHTSTARVPPNISAGRSRSRTGRMPSRILMLT